MHPSGLMLRPTTPPLVGAALALLLGLLAQPRPSRAQDVPPGASSRNEIEQEGEPAVDDDMSPRTATPDPTPEPVEPSLGDPEIDVVEQAGAGGPVPFGAAGTLEVGGSGYFSGDQTDVWASLRPFLGWFPIDGLQLGISNEILARYASSNDELRFTFLGLVDGNVFLPVARRLWVQLGLSAGGLYNGADGGVVGLARTGLAVLVGRSAILHFVVSGGAASAPFATAFETGAEGSHFRVGGEIAVAALF